MKNRPVIGAVLAAGLALSAPALAGPADSAGDADYYFAFDETALRRDIARIRHFYVDAESEAPIVEAVPEDAMVFIGGQGQGGFAGFWDPGTLPPPGPGELAGSWFDRTEFAFEWGPYYAGGADRNPRRLGRLMTGGDVDKVGVRADLTALAPPLLDAIGPASAWRITGTLGSTSLSLLPGASAALLENDLAGELYWDVGVGWSSGPVSLSAGYEATYRAIEGVPAGTAVLSLGADYAVLPGLSVYGELNVVDDPALAGEQGLGTVILLGTGLNF